MDSIKQEIKECLDTIIKPTIQEDGGDIEFLDFIAETGTVQVKMFGACTGCAHSHITLKNGIEAYLQEMFPEIVKEVVQVEEL